MESSESGFVTKRSNYGIIIDDCKLFSERKFSVANCFLICNELGYCRAISSASWTLDQNNCKAVAEHFY